MKVQMPPRAISRAAWTPAEWWGAVIVVCCAVITVLLIVAVVIRLSS